MSEHLNAPRGLPAKTRALKLLTTNTLEYFNSKVEGKNSLKLEVWTSTIASYTFRGLNFLRIETFED